MISCKNSNYILNTLDGGDTKDMNVITIFTTNHLELIEPTFLRGKRIGSIISLGFLNKKTAKEFMETAFLKDNYVIEYEGLDPVLDLIAESDIAPAFMAEIVETIKSNLILTDENVVKPEYIRSSVLSYLRQVQLSRKKDTTETVENKFYNAYLNLIEQGAHKAVKEPFDEVLNAIDDIDNN